MIVLDTDTIIDFLRGDATAEAFVARLQAQGEDIATTSLNAAELYEGAHGARDAAAALAVVTEFLSRVRELPLDAPGARRYGRVVAALKRDGSPVPKVDALIAAIALEHGGRVATRNVRHFARVPGLEVVRPEK